MAKAKRKKKGQLKNLEKVFKPECIPFEHFFAKAVHLKRVRPEQQRELELFFGSCGLGAKECEKDFEKCLKLY